MLDSHQSRSDVDVGGDDCAAGVEPRTTVGLSVQPVDTGQGGQQQSDAEGDRCRGDEDADHGLFASVQAEAKPKSDHPRIVLGRGHETVAQYHFAVRIGGDACLVGDEDNRRSLLSGHRGHQVHDELSGQRIERSRRFVGKEHLRLGDHSTCQRDPLRLSAGHLSGAVTFQTVELESFEPTPSDAQGLVAASSPEKERQRHVLLRREFGHELAELEDKTEAVSSQRTPFLLAHRVKALAVEVDLARVGDQDARQAVEQRRFARAARPHHRQNLALFHRNARPTKGWRFPER